jgi:hypothetical protein
MNFPFRIEKSQGRMNVATRVQSATLEELVTCFEDLEDPRSEVNRKHPLVSVVSISIIAVLAGADGPTSIHCWAMNLEEQLPQIPDLPNGIPSHDVIRRVLCALRPEVFQQCFSEWINRLIGNNDGRAQRHVAVDGKMLRGSGDASKGIGPFHLVSA